MLRVARFVVAFETSHDVPGPNSEFDAIDHVRDGFDEKKQHCAVEAIEE